MHKVSNMITGHFFNTEDNQIVLDAALNNGVNFPYGCQQGFCGQCKAQIVEGEFKYINDIPEILTADDVKDNMALLCQCMALTDIKLNVREVETATDIKVEKYPVVVKEINYLNNDVIQLFLNPKSMVTMQFLPGQYIDVIHPDFEPRSFSIANTPKLDNIIELHIKLVEDGKFTNYVFNNLKINDMLEIEGPKGSFYLNEDSQKPIILLATGTGFAPIKAIIEHLIEKKSDRKIYLYWGGDKKADIYSNLAETWSKNYNNIIFNKVLANPDTDWEGKKGFVQDAVIEDFKDLSKFEVYACGAPIMVNAASELLIDYKLDIKDFHADAFEFANAANK